MTTLCTVLSVLLLIQFLIQEMPIIVAANALILNWHYKLLSEKSMPIEYIQLLGQPVALAKCPKCGKPIEGTPGSPYEPFIKLARESPTPSGVGVKARRRSAPRHP